MKNRRAHPRHGFTITEFVVVLALLGLLSGLLLPAVQQARQNNTDAQCMNNLKILGIAVHNAHDVHGKFPPAVGSFPGNDNRSQGTILFYILPFVEQDNLYRQSRDNQGRAYVWHNDTYSKTVKVYTCPADTSAAQDYRHENMLATCNYAANFQTFGSENGGNRRIQNITDGTSNTIMFAERYRMCNEHPCAWGYPARYYWAPMFAYYSEGKFQHLPTQKQCDAGLAQGIHEGGIHITMCDGSARLISSSLDPTVWWFATTPSGGEVLNLN